MGYILRRLSKLLADAVLCAKKCTSVSIIILTTNGKQKGKDHEYERTLKQTETKRIRDSI
jgi:hypothetical protein